MISVHARGDAASHLFLEALDVLGRESADAQGLLTPITSSAKFLDSQDAQIVILHWAEGAGEAADGLLKYGLKHLYFYKKDGTVVERDVVCLLDFYVRAERQRKGVGRELFSAMMEHISETLGREVSPSQLAYDRPSQKLFDFMRKHFSYMRPEQHANRWKWQLEAWSNYCSCPGIEAERR